MTPEQELLEGFNRSLGSQFRCRATWPPDSQWNRAIHLAADRPEIRQVAHMIDMQVAYEHLVEKVHRDLHGSNAAQRLGTEIEDELVSVAQLDEPA